MMSSAAVAVAATTAREAKVTISSSTALLAPAATDLNAYPPLPPLGDARLRHLAARIHRLGERPLYQVLRELRDGANLVPVLERYAELTNYTGLIRAFGGDVLPPLRIVERSS